ncbi:MAG: hypothetical protein IPG58_17600 [Acidobacteria bacterium]|nr:hypothetical protein [Acidobacteriota bacterium]
MSFCLDDGSELLFGPARSEPGAIATGFPSDEPQTAILHSTAAPGEAPTRAQINTTDATAILRNGAEAEPQESLSGLSEKQSFSANRAAKPLAALVVAVLVLVGGFFGYRYFSASSSKQINSIAVMPGKLQLKLSGESEQKLAKKYTDNNEAYQLYLQGRYHWNKRNALNLKRRSCFSNKLLKRPELRPGLQRISRYL